MNDELREAQEFSLKERLQYCQIPACLTSPKRLREGVAGSGEIMNFEL
jgi:hypothetical protein